MYIPIKTQISVDGYYEIQAKAGKRKKVKTVLDLYNKNKKK